MSLPPENLLADPGFVPLTRGRLTEQLRAVGPTEGGVLMVHVRLSALGWVVGGIDTVVLALQDAIGPNGTLMAFCGWEDSPYHVARWPEHWQAAYEQRPPFDPAVSSARRDFGRFPERLRTWPCAVRSAHPEVSFTALGPLANELMADADDPWGSSGPLGRLVAADGQVLLLGAPLKTLTLCHHAESIAAVAGKRFMQYRMPVATTDRSEWREYQTLDTFYGALPYWDRPELGITNPVETLAHQAVDAGAARKGTVGLGSAWLFNARATVRAAVRWLEGVSW